MTSKDKARSMGWLTESALTLKPGRNIDVNNASIVDLKAALYTTETQTRAGSLSHHHVPTLAKVRKLELSKDVFSKSNTGVSERNARDERATRMESSEGFSQSSAAIEHMKRKAEMYEKLSKGRVIGDSEHFMVDFEKKGFLLDEISENSIRPTVMLDSEGRIMAPELDGRNTSIEEERRAWEKQALEEIASGKIASISELEKPSTGVKQNWEKTMTAEERQFLEEVTAETMEARAKRDKTDNDDAIASAIELRKNMIANKNKRKYAFMQSFLMPPTNTNIPQKVAS